MTIIFCQKHRKNTGVNLCEHLGKMIDGSESISKFNRISLTYDNETEFEVALCESCVLTANAKNNQSYELESDIGGKVYKVSKSIRCAGCFEELARSV